MSVELVATARLLSLGLSPPDRETLAEAGALAAALGVALPVDEAPEELVAEYHRLFDGEARCPPYEGSYERDPFRQLRSLADVSGFYRAFGAEPSGPARERADHVGCELEFLAFLAARRLAAGERDAAVCREAEDAFLRDHLGRFLPLFARSLAAATGSPFYAALAALSESFAARELERRGIECRPLSPPRRLAVEADELACGSCPVAAT